MAKEKAPAASETLRRSPRLKAMKPQLASLPSQPKRVRVVLPSQPTPERVPLPSESEEPEDDEPKEITPTERDLESDEAAWALYEKWCIHHDSHRTLENMQRRFDHFKKSAKQTLKLNQKFNTCSNYLDPWSDVKSARQRQWRRAITS